MAKLTKLNRETRITSTSDFTVGDIVDAVSEHLAEGPARADIEKIVKNVVRPCAIGGVPTVQVAPGKFNAATGGRAADSDGNTKRFRNGKLADVGVLPDYCGGNGASDGGMAAGPEITGRMATEEDQLTRLTKPRPDLAKLAQRSKWYNTVLQNGEVWTPYTSRRFLPAQYLGLMLNYDGNIDAAIARRYSLRDCFRLLDNEIEKLIFMESHWRVAFLERSRFLPIETVCAIFSQYLTGLKENINDRSKCTFNSRTGVFWRKIQGEGRVDLWVQKKTEKSGDNGARSETVSIEPLEWLERINDKIDLAERHVSRCTSYAKALEILRRYMPTVSMGTFKDQDGYTRYWLPKAWKEAFKKQGAYYTLKSLIVNCHVRYTTETGTWRSMNVTAADSAREGLNKLHALLDTSAPAYVIHAILKKSIEVSKFDIGKFLRSLRRR